MKETKQEITVRTQGVTAKTLSSFKDQVGKIIKEKLLNEEENKQLLELTNKIKENWIKINL